MRYIHIFRVCVLSHNHYSNKCMILQKVVENCIVPIASNCYNLIKLVYSIQNSSSAKILFVQ